MTHTALDTSFEAELRALFFLFILDEAVGADYLAALDTLTVNAQTFGIGETNLNGTHRLASGELQTRTYLMKEALRRLVIQGLVNFENSDSHNYFHISKTGISLVNRFHSQYAADFFAAALETIEQIGGADTVALTSFIITKTISGEKR